MAFAKVVVFTIQDDDGHKSQTTVDIPSDTLAADATAFASDVATLLDAVIDGVILRIGISETVAAPGGLKTAALDSCDVEVGATLFYNADLGTAFHHRIPTWKRSLIVDDGSDIKTGDTDVDAWTAMMVSGITPAATLVEPSEHRDEDINAFSTGAQTFTKTR